MLTIDEEVCYALRFLMILTFEDGTDTYRSSK